KEPSAQFTNLLLEVAQSYESYDQVNGTLRLTFVVCSFTPTSFVSGLTPASPSETPAPQPPPSLSMRVSSSRDASTHGNKLYFLFAKYPLPASGGVNPVGQAVVKEAWTPAEVTDDDEPLQAITRKGRDGHEGSFLRYARQDGRLYHAT